MARAFLVWGGWLRYCLDCALWIAWRVLVLAGLTALRRRSKPPTAHVVDGLWLWVAYALGMGYLGGWLSWGTGAGCPTWPKPIANYIWPSALIARRCYASRRWTPAYTMV